jgi:hypothetical protein
MAMWTLLIALAVVALIVIAIAGAIIWAVIATRRRRTEREDDLAALGFEPIASPPSALCNALAALQSSTQGQTTTVRNLYRRPTPDGELYLFDIEGGDGGRIWLGAGTLAALIPGLDAPSLVLLPNTPEASQGLAQAALQRALDLVGGMSGMARIPFPDDIEFDERFVVMGDDESAVRTFLTGARRTALLELPPAAAFTTKGDLIALSPYPTNMAQADSPASALIIAAEILLTRLAPPVGARPLGS